jgi:hypothetical protein
MSHAIFNFFGLLFLISPPFLSFFVWRQFLKSPISQQRFNWKTAIDWVAVLSVSGLFVVCLVAALAIPCDVDRFGWECVGRWRSFSGVVVRLTPVFLTLAVVGRKGTRILSILWVIAINFDCLMIDMMA